jgi:hypothetical protein
MYYDIKSIHIVQSSIELLSLQNEV